MAEGTSYARVDKAETEQKSKDYNYLQPMLYSGKDQKIMFGMAESAQRAMHDTKVHISRENIMVRFTPLFQSHN